MTDSSACYGLACPKRGSCARFVPYRTFETGEPIDSCQVIEEWPLYQSKSRAALNEFHRIEGETMGGLDQ